MSYSLVKMDINCSIILCAAKARLRVPLITIIIFGWERPGVVLPLIWSIKSHKVSLKVSLCYIPW